MPGSTGPDNNTYTIPEVQLGDTFNFWRDATNTAIYKLNKLKIYDAVGSGSIGVTYGSTGAWNAFLAPTITEGLTFTQRIVFSSGITAAGVYSSKGITAIAGIWTTGGLSADRVYVSGGSTFASIVAFVGGLSASNIYGSGGSTFASSVSVGGTFAVNTNNLFVNTSNNRVGVGTASPGASLDVRGTFRIVSAGTTGGGSSVVHPLQIINNPETISAFFGDGNSTIAYKGNSYSAALRFNGAGVAWGDIAYYPQGRTSGFVSGGGEFRFTKDGSTITPTANAMVSVGELLSEGQIYAGATGTFDGVLMVNGGATFASTINVTNAARFNGGATASVLDVTGAARFNGGLSASAIYASGGSTFAGILQVNGGATFASTTDHSGAARFSGGATASTIDVTGAARFNGGATASVLDVIGTARFNGGLSASNIYASGGSTFAGILQVNGGATFASTTDHSGVARFSGGATASTIDVTGSARFNGGATASTIDVTGAARFNNGATASTIDVTGAARFNGGATASTLQVTGNATVGNNGTGATLGVCGSVSLLARTPLRFADADSTHYVAFQAPATVGTSITWTLPSADGNNGQVLFTSGGTLSWKDADGVTGSTKQIQYNQGGVPGATAGLVYEFATAAGVCAGTLGLSGGLYCNNNVAIGLTQGAVSGRLYPASTAKLEVRGDIRIPSNGFFGNKGMTLPSATEITVAADENVFMAGTLVVPSGATLTVQTNGYIVIL